MAGTNILSRHHLGIPVSHPFRSRSYRGLILHIRYTDRQNSAAYTFRKYKAHGFFRRYPLLLQWGIPRRIYRKHRLFSRSLLPSPFLAYLYHSTTLRLVEHPDVGQFRREPHPLGQPSVSAAAAHTVRPPDGVECLMRHVPGPSRGLVRRPAQGLGAPRVAADVGAADKAEPDTAAAPGPVDIGGVKQHGRAVAVRANDFTGRYRHCALAAGETASNG